MKVIENYIRFLAVQENLLILKFEMPAWQLFLFWLLSSECGVSFYWGPARVNFDSSLFWNCIFTTEKNLTNTSNHLNKFGGN